MRELVVVLSILMTPLGLWFLSGYGGSTLRELDGAGGPPALSEEAEAGRIAFDEACAGCHGTLAEGTETGPPLIHPDYASSLRSNTDFRRAVRQGVPAWRWWYGDMPAVRGVTERELSRMIRFVRELQRAQGID